MKLSEVRSQLRSFLIGDWAGILLNPNYVQQGHAITWNNYHSMMLPERLTFKDVAALYKEGQYSFQLSTDGSIFQFYYAYDNRNRFISTARIAFYEANGSGFATDASPIPQEAANGPDVKVLKGPLPVLDPGQSYAQSGDSADRYPRWFRIDFLSGNSQCVLHNECHLHFSGFPGSRLVVAGVPTPKQFVEFVLSCCYPDLYSKVRLDGNGNYRDQKKINSVNAINVPIAANPLFKQITHIRIPGA